jgi:hypothetical protein
MLLLQQQQQQQQRHCGKSNEAFIKNPGILSYKAIIASSPPNTFFRSLWLAARLAARLPRAES